MTFDSNTPIDPRGYEFTVADAALVSGVSQNDIRNWMRRDVVSVGKKSRIGRIMFCPSDIVALRVIGDLNSLLSVDPSASKPVATYISNYFNEWMQRENRHLTVTESGHLRETRLILRLNSNGEGASIEQWEWGESVFNFKIPDRDSAQNWARRPMLILPVEQIFFDVIRDLSELLEQELNYHPERGEGV